MKKTSSRNFAPDLSDPNTVRMRRGQARFGLWVGVGLFVVSFVFLYLTSTWIRRAMAGPVTLTSKDLRAIRDPDTLPSPFVLLRLKGAIDTGVGIKKGDSPKSRFLLVPVEDRWLVAEVPARHRGDVVEGYLLEWRGPLRTKTDAQIRSANPKQAPRLLPYQFDGVYGYRSQCWAAIAMIGLGLLFAVLMTGWGIIDLLKYRDRPPQRTPPPEPNDLPFENRNPAP